MDVYVVLDQVRDEPGKVLGVATAVPGAQAIADSAASGRSAWTDALHTGKLARDAGDGWQEIVRVPLAGYIGDLPIMQPIDETCDGLRYAVTALTTRSEIEEIGRQFGAP